MSNSNKKTVLHSSNSNRVQLHNKIIGGTRNSIVNFQLNIAASAAPDHEEARISPSVSKTTTTKWWSLAISVLSQVKRISLYRRYRFIHSPLSHHLVKVHHSSWQMPLLLPLLLLTVSDGDDDGDSAAFFSFLYWDIKIVSRFLDKSMSWC
jgi:hypothetical protein